MGKYSGQTCPICGQLFTEKDEISVCPDCGAPHHRDCVIAAGRCAYADRHGTRDAWQPPKDTPEGELPRRCGRCGAENSTDALFCTSCGSPLGREPEGGIPFRDTVRPGTTGYNGRANPFGGQPFHTAYQYASVGVQPDDMMEEDVTYREAAAYVGQNVPYFVSAFHRFRIGRTPFNWAAFLLGYIYLFYRRMYGVAVIALVLGVLLDIPSTLVLMADYGLINVAIGDAVRQLIYLTTGFLPFLLHLFIGFFANRIYRRQTIRQIRRVRTEVGRADQEEYLQAIARKGGASFAVVLMIAAVRLLFTYIGMFLLML